VLDRLRAAVTADELAQPIGPALQRADHEAYDWAVTAAPAAPVSSPPAPPMDAGSSSVPPRGDVERAVEALRAFAREHADSTVVVEWRAER
jgi:hypothetical protein